MKHLKIYITQWAFLANKTGQFILSDSVVSVMLPLKHLLQYEDGITLQRAKKAVIGHKHLTPIYVVYLREIGDSNVQYEIVNGKLITETKHENINIDFKVKEAPVKVEKVKSIFDEEEF